MGKLGNSPTISFTTGVTISPTISDKRTRSGRLVKSDRILLKEYAICLRGSGMCAADIYKFFKAKYGISVSAGQIREWLGSAGLTYRLKDCLPVRYASRYRTLTGRLKKSRRLVLKERALELRQSGMNAMAISRYFSAHYSKSVSVQRIRVWLTAVGLSCPAGRPPK